MGYLLGRKHRFRTAAAAAVVAGFGGTSVGGVLLQRGTKILTSPAALGKVSPQLGDLADTVRGDLLEAGKAAVSAAVTSRIDSLTDSLRDQAERIRNPAETVTDAAETATGAAAGAARGTARAGTRAASGVSRRVRGRGAARIDEDERAAEAPLDEEAQEAARDEVVEDEDYEAAADEPYEDEDQEEPEERPARRAAPRRRPAVTRSRR